MTMNAGPDFSLVAVDKFIQATRDSGYKGTSSAVAELVDNSLQAGATEIAISITVNRTRGRTSDRFVRDRQRFGNGCTHPPSGAALRREHSIRQSAKFRPLRDGASQQFVQPGETGDSPFVEVEERPSAELVSGPRRDRIRNDHRGSGAGASAAPSLS